MSASSAPAAGVAGGALNGAVAALAPAAPIRTGGGCSAGRRGYGSTVCINITS